MDRKSPFFAHPDVRDGLISEWECGENLATPVVDLSGNGNDCVITGASRVADSDLGGHSVLDFDGIDDKLVFPNSILNGLSEFSITILVNFESLGADNKNNIFLAERESFPSKQVNFYFKAPNEIEISIGDGDSGTTVTYTYVPTLGEWLFFSCTFNAGAVKIYKNAVLKKSETIGELITDTGNANYKRIGSFTDVVGHFLEGKMGNIRVYNKALSADDFNRLLIFLHKKYGLKPGTLN
ncbi:LamG domain-containing protein [Candidatus Parcubacteria bacterium]|nr:LamG domain-containing protein [Candidatus Parcubacteria bacterium]